MRMCKFLSYCGVGAVLLLGLPHISRAVSKLLDLTGSPGRWILIFALAICGLFLIVKNTAWLKSCGPLTSAKKNS